MEQIYMMKISEISYNARNFITIGHWERWSNLSRVTIDINRNALRDTIDGSIVARRYISISARPCKYRANPSRFSSKASTRKREREREIDRLASNAGQVKHIRRWEIIIMDKALCPIIIRLAMNVLRQPLSS